MPEEIKGSPAVASLLDEQAHQHDRKQELESGLQDTFPASDPVSMTSSATAGGTIDAIAGTSDTPKVDDALAAVRGRSPAEQNALTLDEIRAMRREISRMAQSAGEIGSVSSRAARTGATTLKGDIERRIRIRPLAAVGIAALAGYIYGFVR